MRVLLLLAVFNTLLSFGVTVRLAAPQLKPNTDQKNRLKQLANQAKLEVEKYCVDPNLPWIQCMKKSDGSWDVRAGVYGAGVRAVLMNDPKFGIGIYMNCPGNSQNRAIPIFQDSCYVDPQTHPYIPVFIKILQDTANQENRWSREKSSAFEKEVRRSRAAGIILVNNHPLAPSLYDIQDLSTRLKHSVTYSCYMQSLLDAMTADEIQKEIGELEIRTVFGNLIAICQKFNEFVNGRMEESHIARAIQRAKTEFWMRARLKLLLLDTVLAATEDMWSHNLLHCDLHFNNIMLLKSYISDLSMLKDFLWNGRGLAHNLNSYYSSPSFHSSIVEKLSKVHSNGQVGIPVFYFASSHIRFIDTSYLLKLNGNSKEDNAPCLRYRTERQEDLNELWRGGIQIVTGMSSSSLLWQKSIVEINKKYPILWQSLETNRPLLVRELEQTTVEVQNMFRDTRAEIERVPELSQCQGMITIAFGPRSKEIRRRLRLPESAASAAIELRNHPCSLCTMRSGLTHIRRILQEKAFSSIPAEALKSFAFERPP